MTKITHYQQLGEVCRTYTSKPEWAMASIRRLLSPWESDWLKFAFNDPKQFNTEGTVNPATFAQVLDQLEGRGKLSESNLVKLIDAFTNKCSRNDWKNLYQPILQRADDHGLSMAIANSHLPEQYHVRVFEPQEHQIGFPTVSGRFYPWDDEFELRYTIVWHNHVESVGDDFTHWDYFEVTKHFDAFMGQENVNYPLIFEGFSDGDYMTMTDMFELKNIGAWPGSMRRELLESAYQVMSKDKDPEYLELGDGYIGDQNTDLKKVYDHFVSLGYTDLRAVLFKPDETTYTSPALLVPVHGADGVDGSTVTT